VFQDGTRLGGTLPPAKTSIDTEIPKQLVAASVKGFKFSADEPVVTQHSVLVVDRYRVRVVGPAKYFNETDWIATQERVERKTEKICGGYKVDGKEGMQELPLFAEDLTVTVRNRATGEVLHTQAFPSEMACPSMAMGNLVSGPKHDAVNKWLGSLIARN
jgi:hypothetical protein